LQLFARKLRITVLLLFITHDTVGHVFQTTFFGEKVIVDGLANNDCGKLPLDANILLVANV